MFRTSLPKKYLLSFVLLAIGAIALLILSTFDLRGVVPRGGLLEYHAFDVGQGDSSLFIFPDGSTMLVDAGTAKASRSLVEKLRALGVTAIDLFVATHPHDDHIGGAVRVLRAFDVRKVWDSGYEHGSPTQISMLEEIQKRGIRFGRPKAGHEETIGGAVVRVLAPAREASGPNVGANDSSIVLDVRYGEMSVLMMADAEREERASIKSFPRCVVLKASHHGARNGTDERLMKEARPQAVVLSYADGNRYGHPHAEVIELIRRHHCTALSTADGDIKITSDGASWSVDRGIYR